MRSKASWQGKRASTLALAVFLCALAPAAAVARTWRVTPDGTGDAPTIQAAVDSARAGDVVLVAPGAYTWSGQGTGDEYAMIRFLRGADGFTVRSEAGPELTVLDAERSGRVFYIQGGDDNSVTIEGFTIRGGKAPLYGDYCGGGLIAHLSSPIFRDCVFTGNTAERGGAVYYAGVSGPRFERCVFSGNRASRGAAIYLVNSSKTAVFSKCVIRDNEAAERGGGIYAYHFVLDIADCALFNNRGGSLGGAVYGTLLYPSSIARCTIAENRALEGSALYLLSCEPQSVERTILARNHDGPPLAPLQTTLGVGCCCVWGNAVSDALPAGAIDLGGNFSADPLFCGIPGSFDYGLRSDSPCLPGDEPICISIGAYGLACSAVAVESASWGRIKGLYR